MMIRLAVLLGCALVLGCDSSSTTSDPETPTPGANGGGDDSTTGAVTLPTEVEITPIDGPGFDKVIASNKGSVVLVDHWATWCPPCRKKLPHIVELGTKHAPDGLAVLTVSQDDAEDQASALDVLKELKATFPNYISKHGTGEQTNNEFHITTGAVPEYHLYDRTGKLRYRFVGEPDGVENGEDFDKMDQRVKELLAEK